MNAPHQRPSGYRLASDTQGTARFPRQIVMASILHSTRIHVQRAIDEHIRCVYVRWIDSCICVDLVRCAARTAV
jgi:hypothetical protein